VVEPNADVQAELRGITAVDLGRAADAKGDPIVPSTFSPEDVEQLATIINQCMTLVAPEEDSISIPAAGIRQTARAAKSTAAITGRIKRSRVPEQHWRARVGGGKAQFEKLTAQSAGQALAAIPGPAGDLLEFPDWGDIWESVRNAAATITNTLQVIVSAVGDVIQVSIEFVSDTFHYVWNGVISLVEQAFDIIEGIFETIGAAFQRLFEWLAFLFNWNDILNTKAAIRWMVEQGVGALSGVITAAQQAIDRNIGTWQQDILNYLQNFANQVAGRSDVLAAKNSVGSASNAVEQAQSHNVVFSAFLNNSATLGPPPLPAPDGALKGAVGDDPISTFITNLENTINNILNNQGFANAQQSFQNMAGQFTSDPMQAFREALAGFVEILAGLVTSGLEVLKFAIDTLLQTLNEMVSALQTVVTTTWNIPFVSALYSYITATTSNPRGDTLCALDLACLAVAIPATVLTRPSWATIKRHIPTSAPSKPRSHPRTS
jgi:hypothetical protein